MINWDFYNPIFLYFDIAFCDPLIFFIEHFFTNKTRI